MQYLIHEEQWDGVEGHDVVIGATAQTANWWQALYEFYYRAAFAAVSNVPYHNVFLQNATGDVVDKRQFTPDRLNTGGNT